MNSNISFFENTEKREFTFDFLPHNIQKILVNFCEQKNTSEQKIKDFLFVDTFSF